MHVTSAVKIYKKISLESFLLLLQRILENVRQLREREIFGAET